MKIVVLGAGGLGCVYGGYLARAGYDVTIISRPRTAEAIAANGLRISGHDDFVVWPHVTSKAKEVTEADLLLVCVRSTDLAQALASVAHLRPEMVAGFQNGIRKDDALVNHFGPGPVLGATSIVGARMVDRDHARCTFFAHTWFGERDNHITPRLRAVAGAWSKAELLVDIPNDIEAAEWSKLAYLLPVSAMSALTRLPYHHILKSPDLAYLFVQLVREVNKVARAYNVTLGDYPGIAVRSLLECKFDEAVHILIARGKALEASGQTDISTNILNDILMGRPTEIEAVAGDIVRLANDAGLALPAISFAYRAIRGIDATVRNG